MAVIIISPDNCAVVTPVFVVVCGEERVCFLMLTQQNMYAIIVLMRQTLRIHHTFAYVHVQIEE